MDPNKLVPNSHKKAVETKPKAPPVVVSQRAGLHPMSKTAQGLMGVNRKKGS
jgi:hypothetical protein